MSTTQLKKVNLGKDTSILAKHNSQQELVSGALYDTKKGCRSARIEFNRVVMVLYTKPELLKTNRRETYYASG